jgi:hypothetical protein
MQALEKAQVLQKVNASPSSAIGDGRRGMGAGVMPRRSDTVEAASDGARVARTLD